MPIITLLTDFGTKDGYVGAMKGVIKSLAPQADIVDISHNIPAYSITQAAYSFLNYYYTFPEGTIHIGVIDPGVGSARQGLIVHLEDRFLVGPDNGLFALLLRQSAGARCFRINEPETRSATFHGRDVFAVTAARMAGGTKPEELGEEIACPVNQTVQRRMQGKQLWVPLLTTDRFGNLIFDIQQNELEGKQVRSIHFKKHEFTKIHKYYAQTGQGGLLCLWNSLNFLEIAQNQGSAAHFFSAKAGDEVLLELETI